MSFYINRKPNTFIKCAIILWLPIFMSSCDSVGQINLTDVQCIGHRGNVVDDNFQNTMDSFLSAFNIGADGIELDIFHTKDDVAMVFHDKALSNNAKSKPGMNCPIDKGIADFNFKDLSTNCMLKNGDDIPSLEDVLLQFFETDFTIYIEFKDRPKQKTINLIYQIYNDDLSRIKGTVFMKDFLTDPFSKVYSPKFELLIANSFYVQGLEHGFSGVDVSSISNDNVQRLQYFNKKIGLYGVNTRKDLIQAFNLRVNYITTDSLESCVSVKQELLL
ncbi:glycerophosphodiester phosphodiesterase [Reinekea sp.]|uniref:glycerophosphodiester phosphodiesterase n=1 Tax=Reinekea sp. TaxID=1970455 RepID=UPI0039899558